jgi:sugar (pentulose or hexulose) kinase
VVALSVGGEPEDLGAFPDTVINHNALGQPLPSVRLMGGREYEIAMDGARVEPTDTDIRAVLESGVMLLPALVPDAGPLQGRNARWEGGEPEAGSGLRAAATAFYLALVTAFALEIVGHRGRVFVEGPFAHNDAFLDMLAAATGSPVEAAASATGTAQGAALLAAGGAYPPGLGATAEERRDPGADWRRYSEAWRRIVGV